MFIRPSDLVGMWGISPKLLVHVGAHKAEELELYQDAGWEAVYWIEAQPSLVKDLREKIQHPSKVYEAAIWDESLSEMKMYISSNSESSSLLRMQKHLEIYPDIKTESEITVKPVRLDELISRDTPIEMLNIDVQGAELRVIKSLGERIKEVKWIYLEVNKIELYEGLSLISELDNFLAKWRFIRVETRWWKNDGWGDALYIREELANYGFNLMRIKRTWKRLEWFAYQRALSIWHFFKN